MESTKTGYERALELIADCKATNATTLDLGNLGLTEVPEALWECVWLERLCLGDYFYWNNDKKKYINSLNKGKKNQLNNIPKQINNLTKLKILSLDGNNHIKKIENLGKLFGLNQLWLSNNKIHVSLKSE